MKTLREFLGEAMLGGAKYAGKPNPNKLKGKEFNRGAKYDDDHEDDRERAIRDRAVSRQLNRSATHTTKHGYDLKVVHTRYKGKDKTHVAQSKGHGDNDTYTLKGRVSSKGVVSAHDRDVRKYGGGDDDDY